jgi:hypothetical protein
MEPLDIIGKNVIERKSEDNELTEEEMKSAEETIKEFFASGKAKYPWDQCIRDQLKRGHSKESAQKICGWIRAKYGKR